MKYNLWQFENPILDQFKAHAMQGHEQNGQPHFFFFANCCLDGCSSWRIVGSLRRDEAREVQFSIAGMTERHS